MDLARFLRRWLPLVLLVVISIAAWQTAQAADIDEAREDAFVYERELTTPVLSARRIPETLRAPVIDDEVGPALDALITATGDYPACLIAEVDDRVLRAHNPLLPLVPASNQKLLTTFAALAEFGPDHRFQTTVAVTGPVADGIVSGDLVLIGGGDPYLSTADWWTQYEEGTARYHTRLEDLADAVVAAGITEVQGGVLGDDSLFDELRVGPWAERLIVQQQSGPLSALAVNEGHTTWPATFSSMAARTQAADPAQHAAQVFTRLLDERGVTITASAQRGAAPAGATVIASIDSAPVLDLATHVNSYSSNYGAEVLVKHLGLRRVGAGSTEAGAAAVETILLEQGFDLSGVVIDDGSGLAETDLVTCQLLVDLLDRAGADSAFADTLSVGGERGSLRNRVDETIADGLVWAKTGTLNGVTALSGYVDSSSEAGTSIAFAYIANGEVAGVGAGINGDLVSAQEPFLLELAEYPVGPTVGELDPDAAVASN
ncbi:MAG: D-alanyl-D-alanine carboxypeptidase/D-alanyl-D-alanine endopeptidase [Acidimicrobiales bacterium]